MTFVPFQTVTADELNLLIPPAADLLGGDGATFNGVTLGPGLAITSGTLDVTGGGGNVSNTGTPVAGQLAEWTTATIVQGVSTTGTGNVARATGAVLVGPTLGTPASGVATNLTGLPLSTGVTGLLPFANLVTLASSSLFGNAGTVGATMGAIALGTNLSFTSGTLNAAGGGSGSVTSLVAQGGPFLTNGTVTVSGTITNSIASLLASGLILGGGTAAVASLGTLGTTTTVLHGNAAGAPTFGAVSLSADVTGNLPVTNLASGTGATSSTFWRGDGSWSTPAGAGNVVGPASAVDGHLALFDGTTGKLIKDGGTPASGSVTSIITAAGPFLANTTITSSGTITGAATTLTNHGVLVGQAAAAPVATAVGTDGQVFLGQSAADPAWGTVSGDAAITKAGVLSMTSIVAAATVGSASLIPVVTYDTKGRITATTTAANPQGTVTQIIAGTNLNGGTITSTGSISVATGTSGAVIPLLSTANRWSAAQRGDVVALTSGATVTPDFSLGNNFAMTMTISGTLANPTNIVAGQAGQIVITQDGTGGRTLAYGSDFKFPGGTIATLSTAAAAIDVLSYFANTGSTILISPALNFS